MSDNLRAVWQQVEQLLDQGINLIPVRDKDVIYKGKLYEAKTPYAEWKTYQYERIDRAVLFHDMAERYNTTAVAMVCGAISGNLEVIDFDVKYKPGIDAIVLHAINDMYPDILAKMRVHKTRSGGTHLVYRIADKEVPGSTHLAERPATQEELDADTGKNKKKSRCFIETRGTGGLATAPPSLGYTIRKDVPVPTITWEERCSIIEMCRAYNEYWPEEKPYKPPKTELDYYDENPFEHYNRTVDPRELLEKYGWTYVRQHGRFIWFTRPGGNRNEVHGGFNTERHTFRVWGTKADLDSERSYTPSTILAHYAHNDDKSACYQWLVQQGYGKIKPQIEAKIAAKHARNNTAMPANASAIAIEAFNRHVEQTRTQFPHGTFWEQGDDGAYNINRHQFARVAGLLGFRVHNEEVVQIVEQFIHKRDLRYFFDAMRTYIQNDDAAEYELTYNALQPYLEKHGKFESTQLDHLDVANILQDTRAECYKFYTNGCVYITAQGYALIQYSALADKLIWHEKVQQREFNTAAPIGGGLYTDFLERACKFSANKQHIMRVIGWLAHDYKDSTTGYIITLVEACADPSDGGGSGKNLFCELLNHTTTVITVAAGQRRDNINLFQSWNGERILVFSDPKKDFDFEVLKEPATGSAVIKKLFKNERVASNKELPKLIVATNFSYEITDGGLRRRIIAIEFTNFFTEIKGGVRAHYNKRFPDDWERNDWHEYDHLICQSIQLWIEHDLSLEQITLTFSGWEKQFTQTYGQVIAEFIKEKWTEFSAGNFISNQAFNDMLVSWMVENNYNTHKKPSTFRLNKALEEWAKKHNYIMSKDAKENTPFSQNRGRKFYDNSEEAPF